MNQEIAEEILADIENCFENESRDDQDKVISIEVITGHEYKSHIADVHAYPAYLFCVSDYGCTVQGLYIPYDKILCMAIR